MSDKLLDKAKVDRRAFSVVAITEADKLDDEYWRSRTPDERGLTDPLVIWLSSATGAQSRFEIGALLRRELRIGLDLPNLKDMPLLVR